MKNKTLYLTLVALGAAGLLIISSVRAQADNSNLAAGSTDSSSSAAASESSASSSSSSVMSVSSSSSVSSESSSSSMSPLSAPVSITQTVWYPVSLTENSMSNYYVESGSTTVFNGTLANYSNTEQTVLVDVEIYNSSSKERVARQTWDSISFQPFATKSFSMTSPSNLPEGNYFVAVGVYTPGGSQLLGWFSGYQNFTVAQ